MRDYTTVIQNYGSPKNFTDPVMLVRFTLTKSGTQKLWLVKAIKVATGLGLKDSKDIVDEVMHQPITFSKNMTFQELDTFKENLRNTDAEYKLDDREKMRNRKLISLGLGTKNDIIEELVDINIQNIFNNRNNIEELLKNIYSHLDENKLKEIYESNM